jgi:hypothetical protein
MTSATIAVDAAPLAESASARPQPASRPRMIKGLVVALMADGLVFEGGAERRVLRGRDARSLIPRLVEALDGTRDIDEVARVLADVPADHVGRAVGLMWSLGLLEEGGERPTPDGEPADHAYLRRLIGTATGRRSTDDTIRRMREAEVVVVAGQLPATLLARQLDAIGIGETSTVAHASLLTRRLDVGPHPDLVVVAEQPLDRRCLLGLDRSCAKAGVPWLRTAVHRAGFEIGPLFQPGSGPCYRCFGTEVAEGAPERAPEASITEGWAALVAVEIVHLLAGIGPCVSAGQVTVFDLDLWEEHRSTVRAGAACSCAPHPSSGPLADRNQFLERR